MVKLYGEKPDLHGWVKAMNKDYNVKEIIFFADFSNNTLAREINRIREVSSNIVQTANASQNHKKDFTDFIMLDHIYQRAMSADGIDTFIIFSGDGHFSSVVSFLKNVCKKDVGVCGVRDAFSHQLKNCSSWTVELPDDKLLYGEYYKMILDNLKRIEGNGYKRNSITFERTVDAVSSYYKVPAEKISRALVSLMNQEYIAEHEEFTGDGRKILSLEILWPKLLRDGIWQPSPEWKRQSSHQNGRKTAQVVASGAESRKKPVAAKQKKKEPPVSVSKPESGETNKSKEKPVSANRQPKKETVQKTAAVKVVYPVAVEKAPEENSVPVPEKKKKKKRYYYPRKPANTAKNSH